MNKLAFVLMLFVFVLGLGIGHWMSIPAPDDGHDAVAEKPLFYRNPMDPAVTSTVPAKDGMGMDYIPVFAEKESKVDREVLFYRNPMNPEVTSPVPAKDWMGMDYVPVYANSNVARELPGTVRIDPVIAQNMGVRTGIVERRDFSRIVHAFGRIDVNEERITRLHPKIDGWIEEIFIDKSGELVSEDDILLGIYSPKLVATQEEYLLALAGQAALSELALPEVRRGAEQLVESSRSRLEFFDVPVHQIEELEESKSVKKSLHIHSASAGTVISVGVRKGQYVTPKTELYQITDLRDVWVYAEVYDHELPWIKLGNEVEMTLVSVPGEVFSGVVSYIYPYAESKTRTTKVRIVFDNAGFRLRPEMLTEVKIYADEQQSALVIPSEAVVRSGDKTQVFVEQGEGKYEPRTVLLGISSGNEVSVLSGLVESERVVTSAQFLIDSESKLNEAVSKMLMHGPAEPSDTSTESAGAGVHNHD